jgi:hypothetical protein
VVNTSELHDNGTEGNVISNSSKRVVWQKVGYSESILVLVHF